MFLLALATSVGACRSGAKPTPEPANDQTVRNRIQAAIDAELSALEETEPGLLIAVSAAQHGRITGVRGMADLERGAALDSASQMRIASLTKQFVAVTVLQLVERRLIDLDAPIATYLPSLADATRGVSVRMLLNHTSGVADHGGLFINHERVAYDANSPGGYLFAPQGTQEGEFMPTNDGVVAILAEFPRPRFAPETRWEYSNTGYILLVEIIERVTGDRFREVARRELFEPLGMTDSGVLDELRPRPPRMAASYEVENGAFQERDYSPFNLLYGDGGIYSSLRDLERWRRAFVPNVLLSASSLEQMRRPARLAGGDVVRDTPRGAGYGMGWFLDTVGGEEVLLHGGGWVGVRHAIYHIPSCDAWVVVLSNRADTRPYDVAERVTNAVMGAM